MVMFESEIAEKEGEKVLSIEITSD